MDVGTGRRTGGTMDRRVERWTGGWNDGRTGGTMDGRVERWTDGRNDGRAEGTDGGTNRRTEGRTWMNKHCST